MTEKQKLNSLLDDTVQREVRKAKLALIKKTMDGLIQQLATEDMTGAMRIQSTVNDVLTPVE